MTSLLQMHCNIDRVNVTEVCVVFLIQSISCHKCTSDVHALLSEACTIHLFSWLMLIAVRQFSSCRLYCFV